MLSSILVFVLYFLPSVIAVLRHHKSAFAIIIVNIFFGWTVIGYFWALIWSATNPRENTVVINNNVNNAL